MSKLKKLLYIALLMAMPGTALAAEIPDTQGNRLALARQYFDLIPMKGMVTDIVKESAKNLPSKEQASLLVEVTKMFRMDVLESVAIASLARHLTVKELQAFIDFYRLPEGQSAMKKMPLYMADVMPTLQSEMMRIDAELRRQSGNK